MAEAASATAFCVPSVMELGSGWGSRGKPHLDPLEEEEERRDLCWGGDKDGCRSCSEAATTPGVGCADAPCKAGDPSASLGDPPAVPGDGGSGGSCSSCRAASSSAVAESGSGGIPSACTCSVSAASVEVVSTPLARWAASARFDPELMLTLPSR